MSIESQEALIKKRASRARLRAKVILEKAGYSVFESNDKPFSLIGARKTEVRLIRIALGGDDKLDCKSIKEYNLPSICSMEIWIKKLGDDTFIMRAIRK